jgi:DNA-binding NarL/FixJ family response regulator
MHDTSPVTRIPQWVNAHRPMTRQGSTPKGRAKRHNVHPAIARLVLADEHPIVLFGLEQLFSTEPGLDVVACCTDGIETLAAVRRYRPEALVLDAHLPRRDGLKVLRDLRQARSRTRVVLMADTLDEAQIVEAFRLGVAGMLLKEMALPMVVQCVRKVLAGETWIEKRAFKRALDTLLRREAGQREVRTSLTPRELEVARLAARGLRIQEMARRLGVSPGTVKTHLHRVYRKLKVDNRVALTLYVHSRQLA